MPDPAGANDLARGTDRPYGISMNGDPLKNMTSQDARPIVVGYDGSPHSTLALRWALDEASRTNASILIVHAAEQATESSVIDQVRADAATLYPDLRIVSQVRTGNPTAVLCALSTTARMIVVGTRSRGGLSGLFAGSISVSVAMHAHCPVVAVRQLPEIGEALPVVVGVDDSPQAALAVGFAYAEAARRNVGLVVIRAWHPPLPDPYTGAYLRAEEVAEMETAEWRFLHDSIDPIAKAYPDVRTYTRLMAGSADAALVDAATHAQLVVVGSRGRGGFAGLLLGSVGLHLLHHSPCPVAIIRETAAP